MSTSTPEQARAASPEADEARYIHGTEPAEQRRLSVLNQIMNRASLREMNLCGGERILDLGSGLGQLSRAMARAAGFSGKVIGIERSPDQLRLARLYASENGDQDLVEFRQGDAACLTLGDSEWGSFDVVHTRFLLEHLPDPLAIVRQMVRAARPGGRIILEDDDHEILRLFPEPPGFTPLWNAYMRAYDRLGNDPLVGRRLVWLLREAGATPLRNTWIFFGSCAGNPDFELFVDNMIGVITTAEDVILSRGLLSPDTWNSYLSALRDWKTRNDAAMWYAMSYAEAAAPQAR